ncbi:hypothetical protein [Arcticibacter sp.]|uniref:hypothetical protein n=1 Tax=Arcticibacter sp. TaxID=1872630 RepID=UPI00389037FB
MKNIAKFTLSLLAITAAFFIQPQGAGAEGLQHPEDEFWTSPKANFEVRKKLYLEYCAVNGKTGGREGVFSQVARLHAGLPVDEALVREAIAVVYENRDCNDFAVGGLLRLVYVNKERNLLSASLLAEVEKCLLSFKYWWDEPIKDPHYRCYHTENHQGLYHSDELLAGQLFKNKIFKDGKNGQVHMEHARKLAVKWLEYRSRFGFSEWLSNSYYDVDLMLLCNLYDFAEDKDISRRAGVLIDLLMYDMALNNFKGVFGSTHGRAYVIPVKNPAKESTSSITKLMFGVGKFNSPQSMGAVSLVTSTYRCPAIIEGIANDYSITIYNKQRQSINVEDAALYNVSLDQEPDAHLFWGMQEFIHPGVIRMSKYLSEKYDTWPYKNYDHYINIYETQIKESGKVTTPYLDRFALSEANIATYRNKDYMLSSVQDYRPGSRGYQQHIWQATMGTEALVFTNHPGSKEESGSPNFWVGNEIMPRAAQFENVLVCIYNTPPEDKLPFSHAYFPVKSFDEFIKKDKVVFARKGDAYIALFSQNSLVWGVDKGGIRNELKVTQPDNVWICEMGNREAYGSFENFAKKLSAAKIEFSSLAVQYHSPIVGLVSFGWTLPFTVKNKAVPLSKFSRFQNPYSETAFDSKQVVIERQGEQLVLDFHQGKRETKGK